MLWRCLDYWNVRWVEGEATAEQVLAIGALLDTEMLTDEIKDRLNRLTTVYRRV